MNSQERRMERYRIIYVWKILEGFAPNCGVELTQKRTQDLDENVKYQNFHKMEDRQFKHFERIAFRLME